MATKQKNRRIKKFSGGGSCGCKHSGITSAIENGKKFNKGGGVDEEKLVISYLDKKNNFRQTDKEFKGKDAYEKAVKWGKKNLDNFNSDMIRRKFKDGGVLKPLWAIHKDGKHKGNERASTKDKAIEAYLKASEFDKEYIEEFKSGKHTEWDAIPAVKGTHHYKNGGGVDDFENGEIVWDSNHKTYGVVLDNYDNKDSEVRLDSDGNQPKDNLHKLGSEGDKGTKEELEFALKSHKKLVDKWNYERVKYSTGGGVGSKLKYGNKTVRYKGFYIIKHDNHCEIKGYSSMSGTFFQSGDIETIEQAKEVIDLALDENNIEKVKEVFPNAKDIHKRIVYFSDNRHNKNLRQYKNGGNIHLTSNFNNDTDAWYDGLSELSSNIKEDKHIKELISLTDKEATRGNITKFKTILISCNCIKSDLKEKILYQISKILSSKYKSEFKHSFGGKRYGGGVVSSASEFFSMFNQSVTYNYKNGGNVKPRKMKKIWIKDALSGGKNKGALKRTALRKHLIRNKDEKLSNTDLHKLEKMGGTTAKRAHLAETLKKFKGGGTITADDIVTGVKYKYLHEPNTTVTLDNSTGNIFLFRDQNDEPIGISKSEIPTSIAFINRKVGEIPSTLSVLEVEEKLGRKLHWWNDDVVVVGGHKFKKNYLQDSYKML